jgi:mono/diheme cytochrome c family protein
MADTERRGEFSEESQYPVRPYAVIYDDAGHPLPMDQRVTTVAEGTTASSGGSDDVPFELTHGYGPITEVVEVGPIDTAMAAHGRQVFRSKCVTCHRLDKRYTGPPLRGVAVYRSPTFIMNQILDPKQNVEKHPDMQAMLREYFTVMTNQNVTREDARAIVEYLRLAAQEGAPASQQKANTTQ